VAVLAVAVLMLQGALPARADLRAGLDTLYDGNFEQAAAYFAALAERNVADPAPLVFQAGAYIWWAAARDSAAFELQRIDSLLGLALARARAGHVGPASDFWQATALGYRARQREENGHAFSAAKDAKVMRDIYRRVLTTDSTCSDCYLGLGVYEYGLARAGAVARFVARLIGLGSGNAERGIRYMRRAAHDGDLARVESTWVLAAALMREAARDAAGRLVLEREARGYVETLATRYPNNPVFQRFLRETRTAAKVSATKTIRPATGPATAAVAGAPVGRRQGRQLSQHVVHMTLHRVRGDVESLRDFLVAKPRRDEFLDLLLPFGETDGTDSGTVAAAPETGDSTIHCAARRSGRGGRRWKIGPARDGADRLHDVVGRRVLHDETVGATFDELVDVLLRGHKIHHDRFRVRRSGFQSAQEVVAVAVCERGVEQYDLWFDRFHLLRASIGGVRAGDDFDVRIDGEQSGQAVAHQAIVFDNENTDSRGGCCSGSDPSVPATAPIHRPFALGAAIVETATALGRDTTLDAANGPRHTPPPFVDVMYLPPRSNGSDRRNEAGSA
jgi:hypothetical protein